MRFSFNWIRCEFKIQEFNQQFNNLTMLNNIEHVGIAVKNADESIQLFNALFKGTIFRLRFKSDAQLKESARTTA